MLIMFIVDKEGKIIDPVVMKGINPAINEEALRVIKLMPDWKPATNGGVRPMVAREDTPSTVAAGQEAWDSLLKSLPPVYRRVLVLLRRRRSHEEIAAETGVSTKTVQRLLAQATQQLGSRLNE